MNRITRPSARDRDVLQASAMLRDLDPKLAKRMFDMAKVTAHASREMLFSAGDEPESLFVVLSGHVRLLSRDDEKEADISVFGPGDTFGECVMFLGGCYAYSAQAAEAVTVARFDAAKVRSMLTEEPQLMESIMRIMSKHVEEARLNIANDRLHTAPQRVARYLLDLWNNEGGAGAVRLPFQKSLLAGKLGLAPEALSRSFSTLRRTGVTIRGRMVQIADADALRNI